jgi:hypothetical protein
MACVRLEDDLSPEHAQLVQEKVAMLEKARRLQAELAQARAELTTQDLKMVRAGFCAPVLACW